VAAPAAHAFLESVLAIVVINTALLGVFENVVRLVDLLEVLGIATFWRARAGERRR